MRIGFPSISLNFFSSPLLFTNLQDARFSLSVGSRHGNCSPFGSPPTKLRPFLLISSPVAASNMSRVGMPDTLYLELIFAYKTIEGSTIQLMHRIVSRQAIHNKVSHMDVAGWETMYIYRLEIRFGCL